MDIRFLLVLFHSALLTAGTYSYESAAFAPDMGSHLDVDNFASTGEKLDGDDLNISGSVDADFLNEGSADAAIAEYGMKAKTVEQCAKWYRNLLSDKQIIFAQVKKRYNLLRTIAAESLQSAEQYRRSAAEMSQTAKALETKAREAQRWSKEQAVEVNQLRAKLNTELKQHLNCAINSRVAEANVETDTVVVDRERTWGTFWEKLSQDIVAEAAKWEHRSSESLELAKKLKMEASQENAKGKDFEKNRKEAEDAANETEKKARNFYFFHMEFNLKSQAEELLVTLGKIKSRYLKMIAASMTESASYLEMFAHLQNKDASLWEKKTASVRAEAKLLELSANKMIRNIEKLKASMRRLPKKTDKGEKLIKARPIAHSKIVEVAEKKV